MSKPVLLVDGEVFDPDKPTQTLLDIKKFLDRAPQNEVYSVGRMRALVNCGDSTVRNFAEHPYFEAYRFQYGKRRNLHFGHPEAIKRLKAVVEKKLAERGK